MKKDINVIHTRMSGKVNSDGYAPFPIGLTATDSVRGIHNGYELPETLKVYCPIYASKTPPDNGVVYNQGTLWYCVDNAKVYRCFKNDEDDKNPICLWFEQ